MPISGISYNGQPIGGVAPPEFGNAYDPFTGQMIGSQLTPSQLQQLSMQLSGGSANPSSFMPTGGTSIPGQQFGGPAQGGGFDLSAMMNSIYGQQGAGQMIGGKWVPYGSNPNPLYGTGVPVGVQPGQSMAGAQFPAQGIFGQTGGQPFNAFGTSSEQFGGAGDFLKALMGQMGQAQPAAAAGQAASGTSYNPVPASQGFSSSTPPQFNMQSLGGLAGMGPSGQALAGILSAQQANNNWALNQNQANWVDASNMMLGAGQAYNNNPTMQGTAALTNSFLANPEAINDATQRFMQNQASNQINSQTRGLQNSLMNTMAGNGQLDAASMAAMREQTGMGGMGQIAASNQNLQIQRALQRNQAIQAALGAGHAQVGQDMGVVMGIPQTLLQNMPQYKPDDLSGLGSMIGMQSLMRGGGGGGMGGMPGTFTQTEGVTGGIGGHGYGGGPSTYAGSGMSINGAPQYQYQAPNSLYGRPDGAHPDGYYYGPGNVNGFKPALGQNGPGSSGVPGMGSNNNASPWLIQ